MEGWVWTTSKGKHEDLRNRHGRCGTRALPNEGERIMEIVVGAGCLWRRFVEGLAHAPRVICTCMRTGSSV